MALRFALAAALLCCAAVHMAVATVPVSLYMSEQNDVLNLQWDQGPDNLAQQLAGLGFSVQRVAGAPSAPEGTAPAGAYIIPVQNGNNIYSAVEDMDAVAEFVEEGGLVVVLSANGAQEDALKGFVQQAMQYEGKNQEKERDNTCMYAFDRCSASSGKLRLVD